MTTFFDLFGKNASGPESFTDPEWADRLFPAFVKGSPLRLWSPGDPIPSQGVRVLIGVATWSGYDMRLLDVLAAGLARRPAQAPVVEVFNTADCRQLHDFREYIPKLRQVSHTPVVGIWREGKLDEAKEGYEGRELVARMFGSGSAEIVAFVQDWLRTRAPVKGV